MESDYATCAALYQVDAPTSKQPVEKANVFSPGTTSGALEENLIESCIDDIPAGTVERFLGRRGQANGSILSPAVEKTGSIDVAQAFEKKLIGWAAYYRKC